MLGKPFHAKPPGVTLSRVAIAGSTGYSGQELTRLLNHHKGFQLTAKIGREDVARLGRPEGAEDLRGKVDLAFLCTPNEISLEMAPKLLAAGIHVVDVSGAFRLQKHGYPEWYGFEHTAPEWLRRAEYALYPWKKIPAAQAGAAPRLIANPGCFPTATLMAVLPLLKSGLVDPGTLVVDAKSGTTGAGRKGDVRLLFSEIEGEFAPYKVGKHQHWPEIVEAVEAFAQKTIAPLFVTELLPTSRGISAAVFGAWTQRPASGVQALVEAFQSFYKDEPDVSVGTDPSFASMKAVANTNRVHFQVAEAYGRPVVFSVIDNLVRGAAGQALMNGNLLAGFPVREGLA